MLKKAIVMILFTICITAIQIEAMDLKGVEIHGFLSQGYLISDHNNYLLANTTDGTFQFNELGINFGKQLTDNLRIGFQLFSRDLGQIDNNEVVFDWAYGDYRWRDWLGIRVGIVRQTYGLYNEIRDFDMLRANVLLPQGIYNEVDRDYYSRIYGGSVYGEIPLNTLGGLSYNMLVGTKTIDADSGSSKWTESSGLFKVKSWDVGTFYNGSLKWHTPLDGLQLMASGVKTTELSMDLQTTQEIGPFPAGMNLKNEINNWSVWVLSTEYIWEELILAAEYMQGRTDAEVSGIKASVNEPESFYLSAGYRLMDWFECGAYYSIYYRDKDDRDGDSYEARGMPDHRAWQKDFTVSTRFDINEYCLFKLEGHLIDGTALVLTQENPDNLDKNWFLFAAKLTFNF